MNKTVRACLMAGIVAVWSSAFVIAAAQDTALTREAVVTLAYCVWSAGLTAVVVTLVLAVAAEKYNRKGD